MESIKNLKIILFFLLISPSIFGQVIMDVQADSTSINSSPNLKISSYIDFYYGTRFNSNEETIPYFVSNNKSNEFTINLAYVELSYKNKDVRFKFLPGFGTYMNANYQGEPGTLKNLLEATGGFCLSQKRQIWIDGGVLSSPYTNETAISRDHLMYTRSLAPENVPYYLSGIKLTFPLSKKITLYTYMINGWQQIKDNNDKKSVGTQLEFKPNAKHTINWNTYIGDERSTTAPQNRMRYFSDIFWLYNLDGKWSMTSCIYLGKQEQLKGNLKNSHYWWQANAIFRHRFNDEWSISGRLEYFNDSDYIVVSPINEGADEFDVFSQSIVINYCIQSNALFRLEGRNFRSSNNIFLTPNSAPVSNMFWMVSNITVWF
jgi:hypothetical protein